MAPHHKTTATLLVPSNLKPTLGQLVSDGTGAPFLASITTPTGEVISYGYHEPQSPYPTVAETLPTDDEALLSKDMLENMTLEDTVSYFSAIGVRLWAGKGVPTAKRELAEPVLALVDENTFAVVALNQFLLVLVGLSVAPFDVLGHKIKVAQKVLHDPLRRVVVPQPSLKK